MTETNCCESRAISKSQHKFVSKGVSWDGHMVWLGACKRDGPLSEPATQNSRVRHYHGLCKIYLPGLQLL